MRWLQAARRGIDVVVIDHHQVGTGAAALPRAGQSEPRGRSLRAGASLRRRRRVPGAGGHPAPAARGRRSARAIASICCHGWISWRWRRSATWCRSKGLNRAYVVKGADRRAPSGQCRALRRCCARPALRGPVTPYHFGFLIGPRINAGGRIGDAALGSRLLTLDDAGEAEEIAQQAG